MSFSYLSAEMQTFGENFNNWPQSVGVIRYHSNERLSASNFDLKVDRKL